jgi:hypothetical protein
MAPVRRRAEALLVLLAMLAPACREPTAQNVLDAYFASLRKGRIREAYALTTPSYRAHHDLNAFALAVAREPIFEQGDRAATGDDVVVELSAAGAAPLRLVADGARAPLRLSEDPRDYYPQASPEQALGSFARAVALERSVHAWSLLSVTLYGAFGQHAPITAAMIDLGKRLERALTATNPLPIVIEGNTARFLMSDGYTVALTRGSEGWEIAAFE